MLDLLSYVGWNSLIAGTLAIVLCLVSRVRWLRNRPAIAHGLWLMVLLKLVAPPILLLPILPRFGGAGFAELPWPADVKPLQDSTETAQAGSSSEIAQFQPGNLPLATPTSRFQPGYFLTMRRGIVLLFSTSLLVSLVLVIRTLRRTARIARLLCSSQSVAGPEVSLTAELAQRFGIKRVPPIYLVNAAVTPMLLGGLLRPRLVLPSSFVVRLDTQQLRHVIAHEFAHYARCDHLTNSIAYFVTVLFWWNPFAWLAQRELRASAELCCDALVVELLACPRKRYAQTLLAAVDYVNQAPGWQSALLTSFGRRAALKTRFAMIANVNIEGRISRSGYIIIAFGLLVVLAAPARARIENQYGTSAHPAGDKNPVRSIRDLTDSSALAVDLRENHRGEPFPTKLRDEDTLDRSDSPVSEEALHHFQIAPSTVIDISYILGSVEIEATDSDNAEVYIVRSARAQADLDRFEGIIIDQHPTRLVLRGEDSKSKGIEIHHHIRLRVPRSSQLSLREINGRVGINSLEGAIRLNEVNGDAQLSQVAGELEMISVNGGISLGIVRLAPRGIRLRNVGAVDLSVADGINAELEIDKLQDQPLIETPRVSLNRIGKGEFVGRIGAGGPVIRIFDVRGRVRIHNA